MAPGGARRTLTIDDYKAGVEAGDRAILSRAITLIESRNPEHGALAQKLLQAVLPRTGGARRVGITGVPGVGKSTLIDQLGLNLIAEGKRVAVLAVDPSSTRSGGAILGDKTRMGRLALERDGFIRPSPSSGVLGGVARATRETLSLCEAAGFDVVLVETVGVGQSETTVAGMVDIFVALMLPGAGDDLQGIKRGVIELADVIAVNKADGDNHKRARLAASDYRAALRMIAPASPAWTPRVITVSGQANQGLDTLWQTVEDHRAALDATGELAARRRAQAVAAMRALFDQKLAMELSQNARFARLSAQLEDEVRSGDMTPALAADQLARALRLGRR
jgi:LAO/AO transport system kinase